MCIRDRYWHTNKPGGLHFTISDTGWAKAGWGKIYGQWLCECAVFAYDFDRFDPMKILEMLQTYRISTFCAPPTMYRMLTQNNLAAQYDLTAITHCCSAGEPLNPCLLYTSRFDPAAQVGRAGQRAEAKHR